MSRWRRKNHWLEDFMNAQDSIHKVRARTIIINLLSRLFLWSPEINNKLQSCGNCGTNRIYYHLGRSLYKWHHNSLTLQLSRLKRLYPRLLRMLLRLASVDQDQLEQGLGTEMRPWPRFQLGISLYSYYVDPKIKAKRIRQQIFYKAYKRI